MTRCARCEGELGPSQKEKCSFCEAPLCDACWFVYRNCGEALAEAAAPKHGEAT